MILVTSLSPGHANKDNQLRAIESWKKICRPISLNTRDEIERMKGYDLMTELRDIDFIPTEKTIHGIVEKPLISLNAIFDFARALKTDLLLTNSDIIIRDLPKLREDGITAFARWDYEDSMDNSLMFPNGYDVFYIPYKFLSIFPVSVYGLGAPWWDYHVPYRAFTKSVPVYFGGHKVAFHKKHNAQYDYREWCKLGEYFRWEFDIDRSLHVDQLARDILNQIRTRMIYR